ncbi:hypothetical protein M0R45_026064 [Rubus argutus]|uniref:Uncharacterized protein n=1 Tax=Rubus argutus TaxID=59490 RepID=A0AAW1X014_RUBAR
MMVVRMRRRGGQSARAWRCAHHGLAGLGSRPQRRGENIGVVMMNHGGDEWVSEGAGARNGYVMMNCELGKRGARAVCVLEGLTWFGMELIDGWELATSDEHDHGSVPGD